MYNLHKYIYAKTHSDQKELPKIPLPRPFTRMDLQLGASLSAHRRLLVSNESAQDLPTGALWDSVDKPHTTLQPLVSRLVVLYVFDNGLDCFLVV